MRAEELYAESLAIFMELGSNFDIADVYYYLGQTARLQGDLQQAWARFRASLARWRALNVSQWGWIAECLDGMATICLTYGNLSPAGRLAGAAEAP